MARGKYAKKAVVRRDRESLAADAAEAGIRASRAESERERLAESSAQSIARLTEEVAALRDHVANGTSGEVIRLRDQVEKQRRVISDLRSGVENWGEWLARREMLYRRAIASRFGVSAIEAVAFFEAAKRASLFDDPAEQDRAFAEESARMKDNVHGRVAEVHHRHIAERGRKSQADKRLLDELTKYYRAVARGFIGDIEGEANRG